MYIIKNALRNITRSKGRSILMGIILLVIVISCCLALSIRQAASDAKEEGLASLSVTGQISMDRSKMMEEARENADSDVDRDSFKDMMGEMESLTLAELKKYAQAKSVKNFYYTLSASLDASGDLEAVESSQDMGGQMPGGREMSQSSGDFTLTGYSSDEAMTDFTDGNASITDGKVFEEGTEEHVCIVSEELAEYNSLEVGDKIKLCDPGDTDNKTQLKVVGIYESTAADSAESGGMPGGFGPGSDSANRIYTSYAALENITKGLDVDGMTSGTYSFANVEDYKKFEDQARTLGLGENYTISSRNVTEFEESLLPLENLSKFALYFLIIVLLIGVIILVVINIFSIRERKYEVGVLTAMGMKKHKVAMQFITETLITTLIAIIIGTAAGAAVSVPVTNSLLESQITVQAETVSSQENSFGRELGQGGGVPGGMEDPGSGFGGFGGEPGSEQNGRGFAVSTVSEVTSAANMTVVLQLLGIGLLLSLAASGAAVNFIMRYEPLSILTNRD